MNAQDDGVSHPGFDDFELEVLGNTPRRGATQVSRRREYMVRLRTPAGDEQVTMRLPFDQAGLTNQLLRLENAILRSGNVRRVLPGETEREVEAFGTTLFRAVLQDTGTSLYYESRAAAERERKGLRIKLRIEPPELAALPWEFLFDPRSASFVGLSTSTPIVRDLGLPLPIEPLAVDGPLRILGMVASPSGLEPLDVKREQARVETALAGPITSGAVDLHWLGGQTWRELMREVRRHDFHVFHFIGHGGFAPKADQGVIALADEDGKPDYLPATRLAMLLADEEALRLAVLNSCDGARAGTVDIFSSTASILVRRAVPAVLAMQYEISDEAAIEFSRTFYEAIADGMPIDAAVADARKAVLLANAGSLEWATPVLYQRAPDGVLFALSAPVPPEPPPQEKVDNIRDGKSGDNSDDTGGDQVRTPATDPPAVSGTGDAPQEPAPPGGDEEVVPPGGSGAPPQLPGPGSPPEAPRSPGAGEQSRGSHGRIGARAAVDRLVGSASARALALAALAIALLGVLVIDPTPWAIAAACIGLVASIALVVGHRATERDAAPARRESLARALRPAAIASAGIGATAVVLVAAGIPGLSSAADEIDGWSTLHRLGAVLAGIGAIALGALVAGMRRPRWVGARSGGGATGAVFLAALIAFLPFGGSTPGPVVAAACDTDNAVLSSATAEAGAQADQPIMFRGTAARTGRDVLAAGALPDVQRLVHTGGQVWSSPTVAGGQLFVGSNDGMVYGVDLATGRPLPGWPHDTGGYVYSSPTVAGGVVYVGSSAAESDDVGQVHAIDIATGEEIAGWPIKIEGKQVYASPIVREGKVYVGGTDGSFYIIDAKSGDSSTIDLESSIWSTAAVANGVAYVGVQDNAVKALDLAKGTVRWSFATNHAVISSPALIDGTVYVGSYDGCVYAIDAERGTERWRFQTGGEVDSSPAVVGGVVYVGSWDKHLYAIDADTGRELWRSAVKGMIWSSPAVSPTSVYFSSDDGRLYAVDITDRSATPDGWSVDILEGEPILSDAHPKAKMRSSPLLLGDAVVIGSVDGNLYLVTLDLPTVPRPAVAAAATPEPVATPVP